MRFAKIIFFIFLYLKIFANFAYSKTVILGGELSGNIFISQNISFQIEKPLNTLKFKFAIPSNFNTLTVNQKIEDLSIKFYPEPAFIEDKKDNFGNVFKVASWNNLKNDVRITLHFVSKIKTDIKALESKSLYPLEKIPEKEKIFLKSTDKVQSNSEVIKRLANEIVGSAVTEYEAVKRILNYVVDNVKYTYNPPKYDAIYTLNAKSGNCQNFAHLALALLRASGIPARIVGGISLKEPLKIPVGKGEYIVQSLGQGGHAWIEVYFPDLGWLSYDPQQSKQFTSTRHIKQTHGLDSDDINDSWIASPYVPTYSEYIEAKFYDDKINLAMKAVELTPRSYLFANEIKVSAIEKPFLPVIEKPEIVKPKPELKPKEPEIVEFGNMNFPNLVDIFRVEGDRGIKIMDKETAEYVTSKYIFSQAFFVDRKAEIEKISLAMRKFGGDGTVYIDIVKDENGKPGFEGFRSKPLSVENIKKQAGYYWVDFVFPEKLYIEEGRYWIILRHSGEVIMNWFYIPGNPYGDEDDTRSTLKGYKWEDIQNFDFVFKIRAKM